MGYFYAIRLPANNAPREKIAHRLTRPMGYPSQTKIKRFYADFQYHAASSRKIEWYPGELFPPRDASSPTCPWRPTRSPGFTVSWKEPPNFDSANAFDVFAAAERAPKT